MKINIEFDTEQEAFNFLKKIKDDNEIKQPVLSEKEVNHLKWVYSRMTSGHHEDPQADFMIEFLDIIYKLQQ